MSVRLDAIRKPLGHSYMTALALQHFSEYSEPVPSGASCQALSEAAKEHRVRERISLLFGILFLSYKKLYFLAIKNLISWL